MDARGQRRGEAAGEARPAPLVAGVLSGTSADGIDVAIVRPVRGPGPEAAGESLDDASRAPWSVELVGASTEPFPEELGERVRRVLDGADVTLRGIATLNRDLGLAFGNAAADVAARLGAGPLGLVASHGQTVFHHDGDTSVGKVTLQLGCGDAVSEAAGCAAATDFRTRDCAVGGEGAPLVALVDEVLFAEPSAPGSNSGSAPGPRSPLAILNLGGISNWTLLGTGGDRDPLGFDAGPAASLLDGLSRARLDRPFDEAGRAASAGEADARFVEMLMEHPFLGRSGPRSTGRDTFGAPYVEGVQLATADLSPEDTLATAVQFVARGAARALVREIERDSLEALDVTVAGGGVRNLALMGALHGEIRAALGRKGIELGTFGSSDGRGVPADFREAMAFAVLGIRLARGESSTRRGTTGAASGRILGKWSPGPSDRGLALGAPMGL